MIRNLKDLKLADRSSTISSTTIKIPKKIQEFYLIKKVSNQRTQP